MIKVIDLQGCDFLSDREFKNRAELRNTILRIAQDEGYTYNEIKKWDLTFLLDIWNLDIETTKELIISNLN